MPSSLLLACLLLAPAPPASAPNQAPSAAPAAPAPDPFAGLRFLLGEWVAGAGGGAPGEATGGGFTFVSDLDGRVAVRRSFSDYAPRPGEATGVHHEDLTVVHATPAGLRATSWDNEGHVIEYGVTTSPGRAVFESAAGGPGPRFRLAYQQEAPGEVSVTFSIAPPGGEFRPYVSGTARRRGG